jgi:long-chain acyl-CoA synthetase
MPRTIPALLFARIDRGADTIAHEWREADMWRSRTWAEAEREIAAIVRWLVDHGVERGTPVAILSETRPEWSAVDLAITCLGAVTVGIYPSLTADQVRYQLVHSGARVVFVENAMQEAKVTSIQAACPELRQIVRMDRPPDAAPDLALLRARGAQVQDDDVATIIYTSGTTGDPKGVVLTHANFWEVAHRTRHLAKVLPGDRGVIFLPLAHSLQRFVQYRALLDDVVGVYAESIEKLPEALAFGQPTVLASVPRMLEKIKERAEAAATQRGPRARAIFDAAVRLGHRRALALESNTRLGLVDRILLRVADRLVFQKIRERLGGQLRVLACGGARLDIDVARFFVGAGITVLEGWGLTETCAPVTANAEGAWRLGTVGRPLPGVEVRVAPDGELLVRGPGNFREYFHDPEATAAAFDDGWFRTGDIGEIDADGYVKITDRKKEILVTAGGKNVPPVNLEKRLERASVVSQAVVIGDGRPYLVALLVPEPDAVAGLSADEARAAFDRAVADANQDLAKFEQIKRYEVLPVAFSIEGGELTPTLKLKRRVIAQKYADAIERLYT